MLLVPVEVEIQGSSRPWWSGGCLKGKLWDVLGEGKMKTNSNNRIYLQKTSFLPRFGRKDETERLKRTLERNKRYNEGTVDGRNHVNQLIWKMPTNDSDVWTIQAAAGFCLSTVPRMAHVFFIFQQMGLRCLESGVLLCIWWSPFLTGITGSRKHPQFKKKWHK